MKFNGFEAADFDLFLIEGLEDRMEMLIGQLRPKFYALGDELKEALSDITGEEMFPHIAKHARRTTNPPNDSWVAMASKKRGYKALPHFQICFWHSHILIQWGLIYEAEAKDTFGKNMMNHLSDIRKVIPGDYHVFKDHMKPEGIPLEQLSDAELKEYAKRLINVKKGEMMIGKVISKNDALSMSSEEFLATALDTWTKLNHLHKLA